VVVCVMYFIFNKEEHLLISQSQKGVFEVNSGSIRESVHPQNQPSSPVQQGAEIPPVSVPVSSNPPVQVSSVQKVASLVCASCFNKISSGAFCTECGAPLKAVCSNCRKELVTGAKFCPSCGSRFE
ncbi:MAG: zinc ribbon domain-containing protein, partial [Deltaproteobacteria bacterium]|nr:zinc ribbon domain-containing protein [Deltaproteobacteria bacterium]